MQPEIFPHAITKMKIIGCCSSSGIICLWVTWTKLWNWMNITENICLGIFQLQYVTGGEMGFRNTSLTCILAISDLTHFIDSVGRNSYGDPLNLSLYLLQFLKTFLSPSSHVVNKVSRQTNHKQRIIVSPVSKSLPRQYGRRGRKRKTWIDSWKIFVIWCESLILVFQVEAAKSERRKTSSSIF